MGSIESPLTTSCMGSIESPLTTSCMGSIESPLTTSCMGSSESPLTTSCMGSSESPLNTSSMGSSESPLNTSSMGSSESPRLGSIRGQIIPSVGETAKDQPGEDEVKVDNTDDDEDEGSFELGQNAVPTTRSDHQLISFGWLFVNQESVGKIG